MSTFRCQVTKLTCKGTRSPVPRAASTYRRPRGTLSCHAMGVLTTSAPSVAQPVQQFISPTGNGTPQVLTSCDLQDDNPRIAYEVVQGSQASWTTRSFKGPTPPTCVLVHGILGNRRNMSGLARMIVEQYPSWQVVLVDLRCHGESAGLAVQPPGSDSVASAAADILTVLRDLSLFPHMLIGHSFGGKVVMSMVAQFGRRLPRNVQVWVLDTLPGDVRAGGEGGRDHPATLINHLRAMALPLPSRAHVTESLQAAGFSSAVARWAATGTRPLPGGPRTHNLAWTFNLEGVADMYASYETTSLWPLLQAPPQGLSLDFVRAEHSSLRWGGGDEASITACGHRVHLVRDAGHWVHTDNPQGLWQVLAPSFGAVAPAVGGARA